MFDSVTANLLRSAPALPGLLPDALPSILTSHYARLVSMRLRGTLQGTNGYLPQGWPLEKIADAYELLASTLTNIQQKRASAFVAATAHQILARRDTEISSAELGDDIPYGITREAVPSDVSAALLFLISEQYADANEASQAISLPSIGLFESRILIENIRDLT
jgi:hypothetical protein